MEVLRNATVMPSLIIFPYSVSEATMTKAGLSPLYIELLDGHRIKDVKDSYFKPIDVDLLEGNDNMRGFISAIDHLAIDDMILTGYKGRCQN